MQDAQSDVSSCVTLSASRATRADALRRIAACNSSPLSASDFQLTHWLVLSPPWRMVAGGVRVRDLRARQGRPTIKNSLRGVPANKKASIGKATMLTNGVCGARSGCVPGIVRGGLATRATWTRIVSLPLAISGLALSSGILHAEDILEKYEPARRIHAAQNMEALGNELFGDKVNYFDGSTTFTVTDIDLPGNNALPVRLTRTTSTVENSFFARHNLLAGWDIEVPYMSGIYGRQTDGTGYGWNIEVAGSPAGSTQRCSAGKLYPGAVTVQAGTGGTFPPKVYWGGISMHVPGAGTQLVLKPSANYGQRPSDGKTYPWVTGQHWQLGCLSSLANSTAGEGFVALAPDGTRYYFNWMVAKNYSGINRALPNTSPTSTIHLLREEVRIYATRVEDRFGNWVTYSCG